MDRRFGQIFDRDDLNSSRLVMEYLNGFSDIYYRDPQQKGNRIKAMSDLPTTECVEKVFETHIHLNALIKRFREKPKKNSTPCYLITRTTRNGCSTAAIGITDIWWAPAPIESASS
jgi:hypothetical protein